MILLVVDTQKGCFDERLYAFETVRNNIKQLITIARENNVEVVYVQHDDGPGTELDKTADNYEIYEEFAPREDEKRFEKNVNSAFHPMTGLTEYLKSKGEKDIITIGVSTDYCMDATIKSGFEKGFNMLVPSYTNSTYDSICLFRPTQTQHMTIHTLIRKPLISIIMNLCGEGAMQRL